MEVLQAIYFRFRRHRKTTDQTHGREKVLPVDTGGVVRLQNFKECLVCCPYSPQTPIPGKSLTVDRPK
jgi:hypothetical protein